MLSRRGFLLGTAFASTARALNAARPESVVIAIADGPGQLPAGPATNFTRCYTADPEPSRGREAILHGRFPHLGGLTENPGGDSLSDLLKAAGIPCMLAEQPVNASDDTLLVVTATRAGTEEAWFDKSTHVPLLFRWPRRIPAAQFDLLVSAVDIMPTVLGLCGVPAPDGLQGKDLSAWLLHASGPHPECIYAEGRIGTRDSWRMIVRGLDKMVFTPGLDILRLYNLGQDPDETTDLAHEPTSQRKRDELSAIAADWMRRLGDHMDPSGLKRR